MATKNRLPGATVPTVTKPETKVDDKPNSDSNPATTNAGGTPPAPNNEDKAENSEMSKETSKAAEVAATKFADRAEELLAATSGKVFFRATQGSMYDPHNKQYFYGNKPSRVNLPINGWVASQLRAKLIEEVEADFEEEAPKKDENA